jgi:hypothetical protein
MLLIYEKVWSAKHKITVKSFKKCKLKNAPDGTEYDIVTEEKKAQPTTVISETAVMK